MRGEFYKMDFDAWDEGTVDLTLEQEAAYLRLCNQMYRRRGPIPNSERLLCSLWRCHPNKARKLLHDLIAAGKIRVQEDGTLTNTRVTQEVDERDTLSGRRADAGKTGGTRSGVVRRKALETQHPNETIASTARSREEERREEDMRPNGLSRPNRKRLRTAYPDDFEKFWMGYPTDSIMSKKDAATEWAKLSMEERALALETLSAFNGYCQAHSDYRPVHACRYLSQRRFESVASKQRAVAQRTFVEVDTDQWRAWDDYGRRTRGRGYPSVQRVLDGRSKSGWDFPSEWPPAAPHEGIAA